LAKLVRGRSHGRWCVAVKGSLGVTDLRRLEHACAPALEHSPAPLDLKVDGMRAVDEPARLFMRRLLVCGAALVGDAATYWHQVIAG
jgi:hypothetical protein